jgi:hypothetical protein
MTIETVADGLGSPNHQTMTTQRRGYSKTLS